MIRCEIIQKGEVYKLTIADADMTDSGEYTLQIGDRPNRCNINVVPCE